MYVRLCVSRIERAVKRLLLYCRAAEDMEPPALARTTSPNFSELMSDPSNAQQMQEDLADELTRCAHSCRETGTNCHFASLADLIMLAYPCILSLTLIAGSCTCSTKMCSFIACSALPLAKLGFCCQQAYVSVCLLRFCIHSSPAPTLNTYTYPCS